MTAPSSLLRVLAIAVVIRQAQMQNAGAARCTAAQTCGTCIGQSPECAWCNQPDIDTRCASVAALLSLNCNQSNIVNPKSRFTIIKGEPVGDSDNDAPAVLLQPQNVTIRLRPNERQTLNISYRQGSNYPVDIYFLMDVSQSMLDDKKTTASLVTDIAKAIRLLTNNARFGFGTFVDKITSPYTNIHPDKLKSPCKDCAPPYSFKHQLSFTEDAETIKRIIDETKISGNMDAPEGGFDAMMQVAVCGDIIGWRQGSRKLLIYMSDEIFHSAGDGKLGGIVLPNDGECHMEERQGDRGEKYFWYTHDLKQDYPSVYHMAKAIEDNNINVIFAVRQTDIYRMLRDIFGGSSVSKLKSDSGNLVTLVKDNYEGIVATIRLNAAYDEENVRVTFKSKCLGDTMNDVQECDKIKVTDKIIFEVGLEVMKCPEDPTKRRQQVIVSPVGLQDEVVINLDIICSCDCEKPENTKPNSTLCSDGNGTFSCGICDCNKGRFGETCQCGGEQTSSTDLETHCMKPGTKIVCSGSGVCVCGQCQCDTRTPDSVERLSGMYCDCDHYSCDRYGSQLCGGETRGRCICGECQCHTGYTGEGCRCETSTRACLDSDGKMCGGKGTCQCGRCVCNEKGRCYGKFCQTCPECIGNCACNRDCVQCVVFHSGRYDEDECEKKCADVNITTTVELTDDINGTSCQEKFEDDSGCSYKFVYTYRSNNRMHILALKTKVCPKPMPILPIALGVSGGVLALGLLILILWKLLTSLYDKVEYKKFEEETKDPQFATEANPLFRPARSHFQNPTWQDTNH